MTVWVGGIPLKVKGEQTLVEFVSTVPGLDTFNPEKASVQQSFRSGGRHKKLLVLSPVSLVLAKLHALRAFEQAGRQDELHLKTSLVTANSFIIQLLREAEIRQVLWNVERVIAASQIKPYQRLEEKHGFKILSAVPIQQIRESATGGVLPEEERNRLQKFETSGGHRLEDAPFQANWGYQLNHKFRARCHGARRRHSTFGVKRTKGSPNYHTQGLDAQA